MFLDSVEPLLARATAGNGNYNRGYNALSFLVVAYRVAVSRNASTSALNLVSFRSPLNVDAEPAVQPDRPTAGGGLALTLSNKTLLNLPNFPALNSVFSAYFAHPTLLSGRQSKENNLILANRLIAL